MQSKIKDVTEVQKQEYPCLKVFRSSDGDTKYDKVVLFLAPKEGLVVHAIGGYSSVGDWSDEWTESNFELFNGTVELSN